MNRLGLEGEPAPQPQHTLLVFTDVGIWGYACYYGSMPSSPAFA